MAMPCDLRSQATISSFYKTGLRATDRETTVGSRIPNRRVGSSVDPLQLSEKRRQVGVSHPGVFNHDGWVRVCHRP